MVNHHHLTPFGKIFFPSIKLAKFNETNNELNSLPLEINGWEMNIPSGMAYFQGRTVSFRECSFC